MQDETIDVPVVTSPPVLKPAGENSPAELDIVAEVDCLLTSLFRHQGTLLHAETCNQNEPVTWWVRTAGGLDLKVLDSVYFRGALARFAAGYMGGQMYGGYASRLLRQNGTTYVCQFYMANGGQCGFWMRLYCRKIK
jgi:hypothetical protein